MRFWPLVVAIVMLAGTWAGMKSHMSDDSIHIDEGEMTLTIDEYKNLLKFATSVNDIMPTIKANTDKIIILEKESAVHESEYKSLHQEHEDLEDKVSRVNNDLTDKLEKLR